MEVFLNDEGTKVGDTASLFGGTSDELGVHVARNCEADPDCIERLIRHLLTPCVGQVVVD
jgi:hypothetical protein